MNDIYEASLEPENVQLCRRVYGQYSRTIGGIEQDTIDRLMQGAVDLHIHANPDARAPRRADEIDVSLRACEAGMAAVVFKNPSIDTSARVPYVQKAVDEWAKEHGKQATKVFGGLVLGYHVGGLNPHAVRGCAGFGGKYVWTPSLDSSHQARITGLGEGIEVLDANGETRPELKEIFDIIAENDMVLGLCHQSTKERLVLADEAQKRGVMRIELVHPRNMINKMTMEQLADFARKGVYVGAYATEEREIRELVDTVGTEYLVSGTDSGIVGVAHPVERMRMFIATMVRQGLPEEDVHKIVGENAYRLLGMRIE